MKRWSAAAIGLFISIASFAQGPSRKGSAALTDLFYKAETYRITGRTELAKEVYGEILALDASHETALYQLARIWFAQGDHFETQSILSNALEQYPDNPWIWRLSAQNSRQIGDFRSSLRAFERLIVLEPEKIEYVQEAIQSALAAGVSEKALEYLSVLESKVGHSPEIIQQKVELYLKRNDSKGASKVLKEAVKAHPEIPEYRGLFAQFLDGNNQSKKAEKVLLRAVADFPYNAPLAMEYARILQSKKDFETSFIYLEKALSMPGMTLQEKGPVLLSLWESAKLQKDLLPMVERSWQATKLLHENESAYFLLEGERLIIEGDFSGSVGAYLRATELGYASAEVYTQILELCKESGQDSIAVHVLGELAEGYSERIEVLSYVAFSYYERKLWEQCSRWSVVGAERSLKDEDIIWFYDMAGRAFFAQDSIDKGVHAYEESLRIERGASSLNSLAWQLGKRGLMLEKALTLTQESNVKRPLESAYLDTWAWVLYKMGRYAEAQEKMALALQLQRTSPDATLFRHAAKIEMALGNKEKALEYKAQAKELEGNK